MTGYHSTAMIRCVVGTWAATAMALALAMAGCTTQPSAGPVTSTGAPVKEPSTATTRIGDNTASPSQPGGCGETRKGEEADLATWKELLAGTGQESSDLSSGRAIGVWKLSTDGCGDLERAIVLTDCPADDGWILPVPRSLSARALAAHGVVEIALSRTVVADGPAPGTISAVFFGAQSPSAGAFVSRWLDTCMPGPESDRPRNSALSTGVISVRVTTASGLDPLASERLMNQLRERIARATR